MANTGTTAYPAALDDFTNVGTATYEDDAGFGHTDLHNQAHEAIEAIEAVVGTTAGTSVLKNVLAGQFVATTAGTETLTNKTLTSPVINTSFSGTGKATGAEITTGTEDAKIATPKALADADVNTRLRSKVISFTRDLSAAAGDVAYEGVGFQPTAIIMFGAKGDTCSWSIGFADSSATEKGLHNRLANTIYVGTAFSLAIGDLASNAYQSAVVKNYDADGFTLTWAKTGSPTGTATICALCFR
jgi:hypothetical protein